MIHTKILKSGALKKMIYGKILKSGSLTKMSNTKILKSGALKNYSCKNHVENLVALFKCQFEKEAKKERVLIFSVSDS
jgi:hypothetical protein